MKKPRN